MIKDFVWTFFTRSRGGVQFAPICAFMCPVELYQASLSFVIFPWSVKLFLWTWLTGGIKYVPVYD